MSTLKVNALQHSSSPNNNIVLDSGGNVYANVNLTVNGSATIVGSHTVTGNQTITGNVAFTSNNVTIGGRGISSFVDGMRNRIINGDFRIDQRFVGAANNNISNGITQHVVDRWAHRSATGSTAGKLRLDRKSTRLNSSH